MSYLGVIVSSSIGWSWVKASALLSAWPYFAACVTSGERRLA